MVWKCIRWDVVEERFVSVVSGSLKECGESSDGCFDWSEVSEGSVWKKDVFVVVGDVFVEAWDAYDHSAYCVEVKYVVKWRLRL